MWSYFTGIVNKYKIVRWLIIFSFPLGNQQLYVNIQISECEWLHLLHLKGEHFSILKWAFILFQFSLFSVFDPLSLRRLWWKKHIQIPRGLSKDQMQVIFRDFSVPCTEPKVWVSVNNNFLILGTRKACEAKQLNCELEQFHLCMWSTILFLLKNTLEPEK